MVPHPAKKKEIYGRAHLKCGRRHPGASGADRLGRGAWVSAFDPGHPSPSRGAAPRRVWCYGPEYLARANDGQPTPMGELAPSSTGASAPGARLMAALGV